LPWISLTLAISFGLYGYFRKTVRGVESVGGLFVETALASPLAIGSLIWLGGGAGLAFGSAGWGVTVLLLSAGVITSVPLVAFTAASRRIPLSTLGLIQYLTPTLHFLLAVLAFGEPLRTAHLVTFGLIWTGLAVYALDSWSGSRSIPSVRN
jgi:chloramphenicol-sensitive protein RarD